MGNYLNTIDGTLVNNSAAAAVHNMRETDGERKKEGKKERDEPPTAIRARELRGETAPVLPNLCFAKHDSMWIVMATHKPILIGLCPS